MKLTFTRTDAAEWVASTDIGDYTIVYDALAVEYTLYFLPSWAGSIAQYIAYDMNRGFVEEVASKHYQALKGGDHAIR
jgi:hypothetical protein